LRRHILIIDRGKQIAAATSTREAAFPWRVRINLAFDHLPENIQAEIAAALAHPLHHRSKRD